jgi:biotin-(acetyl-CoA carboxylase) ligase
VDRLAVARTLLDQLERWRSADDAALAGAWRRWAGRLPRPVRLRDGRRVVVGDALDVDPAVGLVVRTDRGQVVHVPATATGVC